ncbi:uncharacterized protein PSFLO_01889 [Pseudozyma flocculosa]|uniref:Uncharacterized protein n=1 Tax=Pseudozyma flocculosa TaxID=84751 RepID=A0A5C3EW34_9BASI|nr:uncharacterized protein PSFLO_01889 [Pseudozyma flocculosa]
MPCTPPSPASLGQGILPCSAQPHDLLGSHAQQPIRLLSPPPPPSPSFPASASACFRDCINQADGGIGGLPSLHHRTCSTRISSIDSPVSLKLVRGRPQPLHDAPRLSPAYPYPPSRDLTRLPPLGHLSSSGASPHLETVALTSSEAAELAS